MRMYRTDSTVSFIWGDRLQHPSRLERATLSCLKLPGYQCEFNSTDMYGKLFSKVLLVLLVADVVLQCHAKNGYDIWERKG